LPKLWDGRDGAWGAPMLTVGKNVAVIEEFAR
jgi:hypothetical protein